MATLTPNPKMQFFDNNGDPLVGGKVWTYLSGTSTPVFTKTTAIGDVNNTNPVILDSRGEASIWLDETIVYRFTITTSTDVLVNGPIDGISGLLLPAAKGLRRFTENGSFTVPAGVTKIWISGVAGGGGGSGSSGQFSSLGTYVYLGSGGGSGQVAFKKSQIVTPGEIIPITIGLGGAGGAGGASGSNGTNGSNGTDTIIGTYLTLVHGNGGGLALGGIGGAGGTFGALVDGQAGSDGAGGDSTKLDGTTLNFYSGDGGTNMFGSGGRGKKMYVGTTPAENGRAGTGYGSGGSGGSYTTATGVAGGNGGVGTDGMVLIEW